MAAIGGETETPRAVIHKRILDVASERPDASMAELADEVGGASIDMVERVLNEYGDPVEGGDPGIDGAGEESGSAEANEGGSSDDPEPEPATGSAGPAEGGDDLGPPAGRRLVGELTEKQLEVLEAVHAHPDASQRELGERLGVSASTVNKRLSGVNGFEWDERWGFVRALFDGATDGGTAAADRKALSELRDRVEAIESRLDDVSERESTSDERPDSIDGERPPFPPELAHKVAHACLASDRLDESEELAVFRALVGGERDPA